MSLKTALAAALAAAAVLAPAAPAAANVQVGSSGWQWGNPLPQGNTVRAMSFSGGTGYAAGDFGTLLKTRDGGTSWSGLQVGTLQGLSVVQALDADTVFAGGGCVARRSVDGGATFTAVRFTPVETGCKVGLRDLSFVSRDLGFLLLADGSIFTTTDGGTQFAPRTAVPETRAAGGAAEPGGVAFLERESGLRDEWREGLPDARRRRLLESGRQLRTEPQPPVVPRRAARLRGRQRRRVPAQRRRRRDVAGEERRPGQPEPDVDQLQHEPHLRAHDGVGHGADPHRRLRRRGRHGRHALDGSGPRGRVRLAGARGGRGRPTARPSSPTTPA